MPGIINQDSPPSSLGAEQEPYIENEQASYPLTFADDDNASKTTIVLGPEWDSVFRGECLARFAAGSASPHGEGVEGFSTPSDDASTPCIVFPDVAQSDITHMAFELRTGSWEYVREVSASLHVKWTSPSIDDSKTYKLEWEGDPCGAIDLAATTTAPVCWRFTTADLDNNAISEPCQVINARMPSCKITCSDGTLLQNPSGLTLDMIIELKVPKVPKVNSLALPNLHCEGNITEET